MDILPAQEAAWTELLPACERLDALLEAAVRAAQAAYAPAPAGEQFRGLYVSEADVEFLLEREPGRPVLFSGPAEGGPSGSRLQRLQSEFALSAFDLDAVLLSLAPEIDRRYERLYAYLQDNVNLRRPTVDLALHLFCGTAVERLTQRERFTAASPLVAHGLLRVVPDGEHGSLLAASLKLDEQVTAYLLHDDRLDGRLAPRCRVVDPEEAGPPGVFDAKVRQLARACEGGAPRLQLPGPDGSWLLAAALGREVLELDCGAPGLQGVLQPFALAARLRGAAPCLTNTAALVHDPLAGSDAGCLLRDFPGIAAVAGPAWRPGLGLVPVDLGGSGFEERRQTWEHELAERRASLEPQEIDDLAARLRVSPQEAAEAAARGAWRARWREAAGGDGALQAADLYEAACELTTVELAALARRTRPSVGWDRLVLPGGTRLQLQELCGRVVGRRRVLESWGFGERLTLGKGTVALFAGPPGTGKTLAAEAVATELRLDLCKIDLSSVVSKYIGETEKNLERVFAAAERANAILFFDEADALFGKRSEVRDAHDRYANIEISYLLQRMEEYDGVAVLATNLRQNLDESFVRRIAFLVHFPFPDAASRLEIWRTIWPAETPLAADVDLAHLAEEYKLAGGNIKNVALAAAYLAAGGGGEVTMAHLLQATRREFQKLGKAMDEPPALVGVNGHG